jgi:hypothetical protein
VLNILLAASPAKFLLHKPKRANTHVFAELSGWESGLELRESLILASGPARQCWG